MVGVVLLLLTLAYGLTGYLLPWDNRAYWGTVVTTQIAAQAPVLGPYLTRLLGGEGAVGVVTFARFYGLHVLLLPPATLLLIAMHVYLVRKHGVAPLPGDELLPKKKFYPRAGVQGHGRDLRRVRDPVRAGGGGPRAAGTAGRSHRHHLHSAARMVFPVPVPDAEAVLRVRWKWSAAWCCPGLAVLALILVPFIDRAQMVRVTRRTFAASVVLLAAIGWGGLTVGRGRDARRNRRRGGRSITRRRPTGCSSRREEMAGVAYFRQENCISCHAIGDDGDKVGPDLTADVDPQGRRVDDPAFQTPVGDAAGQFDAADPVERCAVEFAGGVSAETQ